MPSSAHNMRVGERIDRQPREKERAAEMETTAHVNDFAKDGFIIVGEGRHAVMHAMSGMFSEMPFELNGQRWELDHYCGMEDCHPDDCNEEQEIGPCECVKLAMGEIGIYRPAELTAEEFDAEHSPTDYALQNSQSMFSASELTAARERFG